MPCAVLFIVAQPCPTFFDPMDCRPPGSSVHGGFSRQEYWSGLSCPLSGDLTNLGIKLRSPTLQVDFLPSEPPGKPKNTGGGSLSFLKGIFPTQELSWGLLHCSWILYQLSYALLLLLLSRVSRVRLCDPIDRSPPGSAVPGILQARTLEWVAISFFNA